MTCERPEDLRSRIVWFREGGERLYKRNFFRKTWLAWYVADGDVLVDALEEMLNAAESSQEGASVTKGGDPA